MGGGILFPWALEMPQRQRSSEISASQGERCCDVATQVLLGSSRAGVALSRDGIKAVPRKGDGLYPLLEDEGSGSTSQHCCNNRHPRD